LEILETRVKGLSNFEVIKVEKGKEKNLGSQGYLGKFLLKIKPVEIGFKNCACCPDVG
jgi:hypothetical protein